VRVEGRGQVGHGGVGVVDLDDEVAPAAGALMTQQH
jgi:hypothetical protein